MDIVIKWNSGKDSFIFPVNPESFDISESQNNTSIYIHETGEINLKGKRSLKSVSWSCFFPAQYYDFCQVNPDDPKSYVDRLTEMLEENLTCQIIIADRLNMYCTIESFSYGESERNRDISYTITLKEYREPESNKRNSKSTNAKTYTWKKGDTWSKVCKKQLGSSKDYKKIKKYKENKAVIKKAKAAYKKKHKKSAKEEVALIGYEVYLKK